MELINIIIVNVKLCKYLQNIRCSTIVVGTYQCIGGACVYEVIDG
jgi:hypothetical protein